MEKKFWRKRNIVLTVLMFVFAVGICVFAVRSHNVYEKDAARLDSLPELTATAQILEAVNSPQEKLCVISSYKFPKIEKAVDHYGKLPKGEYVFIYTGVSEHLHGRHSDKYSDVSSLSKQSYGKLFFDEITQLLDFEKAWIEVSASHMKKFDEGRKRYEYTYLPSEAELSFVAKLGNGKARLSGFNDYCEVVEGDKARLADFSSMGGALNGMASFMCGVVLVFLGIFVFADYWHNFRK